MGGVLVLITAEHKWAIFAQLSRRRCKCQILRRSEWRNHNTSTL